MATKEEVVNIIKTVFDPEIPVNVYDLGLIYKIEPTENEVRVDMTLTTKGCPSAQELPETVRSKIQNELKVPNVHVNIVWEPAWHPSMISDEGKKALNLTEE